jgi:hypothetical protein
MGRHGRVVDALSGSGMLYGVDAGSLRAGDADRERVAELLRLALEEGRLNLYEYDERLREAYAAKTYSDLDSLLADLPAPRLPGGSELVPASASTPTPARRQWQAGPDGRYPNAVRGWLAAFWQPWARANGICVLIWGATSAVQTELIYFWPGWVAGPWGVVILSQTIAGLMRDEPQRWAGRLARKEAEREVRRQAKRARRSIEDSEPDGPPALGSAGRSG